MLCCYDAMVVAFVGDDILDVLAVMYNIKTEIGEKVPESGDKQEVLKRG